MSYFKVNWETKELFLKNVFTIARGSKSSVQNVFITISKNGLSGHGEAGPNTRYGETSATVIHFFEAFRFEVLDEVKSVDEVEKVISKESQLYKERTGNAVPYSATTAIEMAWLDWWAKTVNKPLWRAWCSESDTGPVSSFTIGIDEIPVMQKKIKEAEEYPLYKIKLGTDHDREIIHGIREVTDKRLRVDANEGWKTVDQALREIDFLASQNVEMVEQPMHSSMVPELKELKQRSALPLCADESFTGSEDLKEIAEQFHIINIKLMKIGSMVKAKRTIEKAHQLGLEVMIGCMIESSLAITAGGVLALFSEYADLDGHLLISNDQFDGLVFENSGNIKIDQITGIGAVPKI